MADGKPIRIYEETLELVKQVKNALPSKRTTTSVVNELLATKALERLNEDSAGDSSQGSPKQSPPEDSSTGNVFEDF